jgi:hypothetical protein
MTRESRKADRKQAKADRKEYDRNHAQQKRQQALHSTLLAAQVKRGKREAKRQGE